MAYAHFVSTKASSPSVTTLLEIIELQNKIASARDDVEGVMRVVVDHAMRLTQSSAAVVELVDGEEMVYRAVNGTVSHTLGLRLRRENSLSGLCVEKAEALVSNDSLHDDRVDAAACRHVGAAAMVCVPLLLGKEAVGVLKVLSSRAGAFSAETVSVLELLARPVAIAIEQARVHEQTVHETLHDPLTGLLNRRAFEAQIVEEVERNRRYEQGLCLVMLDLDGFKNANDRWGHALGDDVLRRTAQIVRDTARPFDNGFRLGGDELALLMPATRLDEARVVARRIHDAVAAAGLAEGTVTISAGVAEHVGHSPPQLVDLADAALYAEKRAKKSRSGAR
jgi:diguanylate cyclase (GGDEF)-like protein